MNLRRSTRSRSLVWLCLTSALATGCSKKLELVPVSGVVTVDGAPVEAIDVYFIPEAESQGTDKVGAHPHLGSSGVTGPDGRFVLKQLDTDKPGTTVGRHKVRMVDTRSGLRPQAGAVFVPSRIGAAEGRELSFEVPPGGSNDANFPIEVGRRNR